MRSSVAGGWQNSTTASNTIHSSETIRILFLFYEGLFLKRYVLFLIYSIFCFTMKAIYSAAQEPSSRKNIECFHLLYFTETFRR